VTNDYKIQFSGLAEGEHLFGYVLGHPFFALFNDEVILGGEVKVEVTMDKQPRMLLFTFDLSGVVEVLCDRCADPVKLEVEGEEKLIAQISSHETSEDDDIVFITEEAFEFDLTQHLYDYIRLALPMRITHDQSVDGQECDPEMIRLLEQYSAGVLKDHRWKGLEGLTSTEDTTIQ
jgi:uncharacterized metal-binding protein YceD (DUF177 family)